VDFAPFLYAPDSRESKTHIRQKKAKVGHLRGPDSPITRFADLRRVDCG
jgi:hypothetical protein